MGPGACSMWNVERNLVKVAMSSTDRTPSSTSMVWMPGRSPVMPPISNSMQPRECVGVDAPAVLQTMRLERRLDPSSRKADLTLSSSIAWLNAIWTATFPPVDAALSTAPCFGETLVTDGGNALTLPAARTCTCNGANVNCTRFPAPTASSNLPDSCTMSLSIVVSGHGVVTSIDRLSSLLKFAATQTTPWASQPRQKTSTSGKPLRGVSSRSHSGLPKSPK
mmetsp:Transcript_92913/g.268295  ORF Transcript_92913/g.268295 Transcript_92913/m.268295 type:complete len:222 (+) Transcript_92913:2150-2815(+)